MQMGANLTDTGAQALCYIRGHKWDNYGIEIN
jgi:hypothetical protein